MPDLPAGTVTFLLTDIQGSTRLWERHPDAMRQALACHDELAASLIEKYEGTLIKSRGEGDSLFAVFGRATDALWAALALQQALIAQAWPSEIPLRVRMALHTGEADLRERDYYGPAVNRCAHLRAIAHGGQVLLSRTTYELVCDSLPEGAGLQDLGEHRLRDLSRPEHVFQLVHPALPAEFSPLKSLDALPNNLPRLLTSFVGREREMEEIKQLLSSTFLLTLTGSGGCGKTRLAIQVAADLLEMYPDGVWLVELAALTDPDLVPQAVASAVGLREEAGRPVARKLVDALKSRTALLVLDNCEHLLEACAHLAETLLRECPNLRILASSREGLGIGGEMTYRVPSLSLPDPQRLPPVERVTQYEAVRLFIERAVFSQPTFVVTSQNAPAVAQICYRLDGIPLAIELAAARVKAMPVEQIAARLDDRFRLLTGGSRTALPRQQTLRALIDWSYNLLSEKEQALLRRLSVFMGGWTLEAAEVICSGDGIEMWAVLDLLSRLVDKSLVGFEEQDGQARYRLLETVRQYGLDKLMEAGEGEAVRKRHLEFFLTLAEETEPKLYGKHQVQWLNCLEAEHDNLRSALEWCLGEPEGIEAGLRLVGALWRFWYVRGYFSEGARAMEEALALAEELPVSRERAKALAGAGRLAYVLGQYELARARYEESLAAWRSLRDREGIAAALGNLGWLAQAQGEYRKARLRFEESLTIYREIRLQGGIAWALHTLGLVAEAQGEHEEARSRYEESLALYRRIGHKGGIAWALNSLGHVTFRQGEYESARPLLEESLSLYMESGHKVGIARSLNNLGLVAVAQGDYGEGQSLLEESLTIYREIGDKAGMARALNSLGSAARLRGEHEMARLRYEESLTLYQEIGARRGIADTLRGMAEVAVGQGQLERAGQLFGAAEALREAIGSPLSPDEKDEEAFAAAWAEGRTMTMEQAIAYALKADEDI